MAVARPGLNYLQDEIVLLSSEAYIQLKQHPGFSKQEKHLDVHLNIGNKTWITRSDLLRRSPWFERALKGNFEDPSRKNIRIENFDPESVCWLVTHLYFQQYDWASLQGRRTFTQLCSLVVEMGDYFELPYLSKSAVAAFYRLLFSLVPDFQSNNPYDDCHRVNRLRDIIREVYAEDNPRARMTFGPTIAMTLDSIQYGNLGIWLDDLVDEIPAVAVDMVKVTRRQRHSCDKRKTPRSANLGFFDVHPPMGSLA
ncbi:hypothetical protein CHU98_g2182 [Xylaria longipes]|nr:hypothetical protein CHU98_g2182 [Xylaria longipes]